MVAAIHEDLNTLLFVLNVMFFKTCSLITKKKEKQQGVLIYSHPIRTKVIHTKYLPRGKTFIEIWFTDNVEEMYILNLFIHTFLCGFTQYLGRIIRPLVAVAVNKVKYDGLNLHKKRVLTFMHVQHESVEMNSLFMFSLNV